MLSKPNKSIAVIGGGLTGLAAAYRLSKWGHAVRLFEADNRLGGTIRTETADGWLIESGPASLREDSLAVLGLFHELNLGGERIEASPAAQKRYILRHGKPVAVPASPFGLAVSRLLSPAGKLRLLSDLVSPRRSQPADMSAAQFLRRHFGRQVFERMAQPVLSGIYAGDPDRLSARYALPKLWELERYHGSILRGHRAELRRREARREIVQPKMVSFRRGLQSLYHAFVLQLPSDVIVLNAQIECLRSGSTWGVTWRERQPAQNGHTEASSTPTRTEFFDAVVCTIPAPSLAAMAIGEPGRRPLAPLAAMEYVPVSTLFLGYRKEQVAHRLNGFGLLIPENEKRSVLGVIFSSSLFPDRAPPGHVALTAVVGGALQPDLARLSTAEILARVQPDLRDWLGVEGDPVLTRHHFWPRAIPQYNLGHERMIETIVACERANPGLFIGGPVRHGVGLPDCLRAAEILAERAGDFSPSAR